MEHGTWNILYFGMCVFLFACFEQQHTKQTHWNSMAICILCARHRIIRKKAVFMTISSNSEMLDVASAPECTVPAFVMLRDCNYLNKQPNSITERKAKRKETLLFLCLLPFSFRANVAHFRSTRGPCGHHCIYYILCYV